MPYTNWVLAADQVRERSLVPDPELFAVPVRLSAWGQSVEPSSDRSWELFLASVSPLGFLQFHRS